MARKKSTQHTKPAGKYHLLVEIGKKGKQFAFDTDNPTEALLSIKTPKLVEGVRFTLNLGEKTAKRSLLAYQARRVFSQKLSAEFFVKTMHWLLKK
ncbi:MAG: hypothetical protein WC389_19615 [Lutibacter sp.]|jgi:hypothetical protein